MHPPPVYRVAYSEAWPTYILQACTAAINSYVEVVPTSKYTILFRCIEHAISRMSEVLHMRPGVHGSPSVLLTLCLKP